jgi:DNA-binding NarL/FixJ family response regulator
VLPSTLRVLLVTEDPIARAGLGLLLSHEGVELAPEGTPADVALVDLRGDGAGVAAAPRGLPWLALVEDEGSTDEALQHGARGVLLRGGEVRALARALAAVASGLAVLEPAMVATARPRGVVSSEETAPTEPLTARELEVLERLAEALPNKLIAHRLGISEHTVKFHVNAVLTKLGAGSRTEAVVRAARLGLVLL